MQKNTSEIQPTRQIKYLMSQARLGSLFYLAIPWLGFELFKIDVWLQVWGGILTGLALFRFILLMTRAPDGSNLNLFSFYGITFLMGLGSGCYASYIIWNYANHINLLAMTMTIAALMSGVMMVLAINTKLGTVVGAVIIVPVGIALGKAMAPNTFSMYLLGGFWFFWNWGQMRAWHRSLVRLQSAERLVEIQEQRLRQFINGLPGFVSWFDKDLRYLEANERLAEVSGLSVAEIIGKNLGFQNEKGPLVQKIHRFQQNPEISHEIFDLELETKTGKSYYLTSLLKHQLGESEEQISVLSLDVTSLKEKELALEEKRRILLTQEKFSALGEMAGGIAHEINNPMAIICGKTRYLLKRCEKGEISTESLQPSLVVIDRAAERIVKIVRALLTLVRGGELGLLENISIQSLVDPLIEVCRARLNELNVSLEVANFQNLSGVQIRCAAVELGQVLVNLVMNGGQAVTKTSDAWVRIELEAPDDNDKVLFKVIDGGGGLTPEVQKKIFQPFFTTKPPGMGTGLGLSVSRELLRRQNGNIYYDKEAVNTTFVIEIPRVAGESSPPAQQEKDLQTKINVA